MNNSEFLLLKEKINSEAISFPELALYLHIPFCASKCAYCDFYSVKKSNAKKFFERESKDKNISRFTKKLLDDVFDLKKLFKVKRFSSIFIGGGTPSILSSEDIFFIAKKLSQFLPAGGEFTIELNPETVTIPFIRKSMSGGINRFSLGVQTFNENILREQRRFTSKKDIENAISILQMAEKKYGVKTSCDLIVGLKNQTIDDVNYAVDFISDAGFKHVSLYTLCSDNYINDKENDLANSLFDSAEQRLISRGFYRYEVSNFSKSKNFESQHNKAYWHLNNYLGVGPSAASTLVFNDKRKDFPYFALRATAFKNLEAWYTAKFPYEIEKISYTDCIKDFLLMGLRLKDGIKKEKFFSLFHIDFDTVLEKTISKYESFIERNDKRTFALNEYGLNFLSEFLSTAFLEIEKLRIKN